MGKVIFDPTMNRWLNYIDGKSIHTNPVFKEGYDDPTYLTFKIEFGDWGASVLDDAVMESGTTLFKVEHADYDLLPIGLLNCPYPGKGHDVTQWQTGATTNSSIFNNQDNYSAFTYLRSRNEDVRAEYLYYFVNGLKEIQRKTPYIFQKITGLDSLEQFDPKRGQRVQGSKIQLECLENISLKIKSLMELYRKAAWDDVYQRWILPENLREFKMIIYVFERRIFLNSEFGVDDLNYEIPVKAYECCPCEFDLTSSMWKGDRDATFDEGMESSSISITVKNVKTFFRNGLLNETLHKDYNSADGTTTRMSSITSKIEPILIYDLMSNIERRNTIIDNDAVTTGTVATSGTTLNGVRSQFMLKNIFLANQEFNGYEKTNKTWIKTLVDSPSWDKQQSFWKNVGSAITTVANSGTRSIMMGGNSDLYVGKLNTEALTHLYDEDDEYFVSVAVYDNTDADRYAKALEMYGYSPIGEKGYTGAPFISVEPYERPIIDLDHTAYMFDRYRTIEKQNTPELDGYRTVAKVEDSSLDDYREVDDLKEMNMEDPRELPIQDYPELETREKSDQQFNVMDDPRDLPLAQFNNMDDPRELPDLDYNTIDDPRDLVDQNYNTMDDPRDLPELTYPEISAREKTDQEFNQLDDPRDLPELTYPEISAREITLQEFLELDGPRDLPSVEAQKFDNYRKVSNKVDELKYDYRKLPDIEELTLDEIRDLLNADLTTLSDIDYRALPNYKLDKLAAIEILSKAVVKPTEKFVELDAKYRDSENATITSLKENNAFKHLEFPNVTDEQDKRNQDMLKFAKAYVENSDEVHNAMVEHIIKVKDELKNQTEEVIRKLPEPEMYQLSSDDRQQDHSALVSLNDVKQIDKNIKLVALDNDAIRDMSIQSLVKLNSEMEDNTIKTELLVGLTEKIEKHEEKMVSIDTKSPGVKKKANKTELIKPEDKDRITDQGENMITLL